MRLRTDGRAVEPAGARGQREPSARTDGPIPAASIARGTVRVPPNRAAGSHPSLHRVATSEACNESATAAPSTCGTSADEGDQVKKQTDEGPAPMGLNAPEAIEPT